jgi:hypothetical protein
MLGFRGHFSTKSRRYSTTLGALRDARAEWRRAQAMAGRPATDTTYVLAHWVFAGTGLSATDAWLAASVADTRANDVTASDSMGGHLDDTQG